MKFTIVQQSKVRSGRLDRQGKDDMWVIFTTEDGRTGSVKVPAETFSDETLAAAVREQQAQDGAQQGRTLEA